MNKIEALKWLVENARRWPTSKCGVASRPDGWSWGTSPDGNLWLYIDIPTVNYVDSFIIREEWLDALTSYNNRTIPMTRIDVLKWLADNFTVWPVFGHDVDCRTLPRPGKWSWTVPSDIDDCQHKPGLRAELVGPPDVECENITFEEVVQFVHDEKSYSIQAKVYDSMVKLTESKVTRCPGDSTCIDQGCPCHYATESPTDGATKYDDDKPMMHLVPLVSVEAVAKVMTFGAKKYAPNGWKDVTNAVDRYNSAMLRHMVAIQKGETIDLESGLPHIDHVACNAMFLSYFHNNEVS